MAAGLTTLSKPPLLYRYKPQTPPFQSLSSNLFGLRISISHSSLSLSSSSSSTSSPVVVSARFGGKKTDDDDALDLSSIRSDQVRLIDQQQNMVGVVSKIEAIQRADDAELDLVVISPDSDPPVVRIMNYDKYRYEQQKKKREQQKKSAASRMDMKELKMGNNIDVHDYSVRLKAAQKFLKDGDKVKVIVNLKGRGNVTLNKAIELIRRFQTDVGELATEEGNNFAKRKREDFNERYIFMVLLPNKNVLPKAQEAPKKKPPTSAPAPTTAPAPATSPFSAVASILSNSTS